MRLEKEAEKQRKTTKGERKKQRCLGMQSIGHLLVELLGTSFDQRNPIVFEEKYACQGGDVTSFPFHRVCPDKK